MPYRINVVRGDLDVVLPNGGGGGGITSVSGTANQVTAVTLGSSVTVSTPTTFIAPGSIESTTSLKVGQNIDITGGEIHDATTNINFASSGTTLDGNSYIVLVDQTDGNIDVKLPASPQLGQSYIIFGTVLSGANQINILGNGNDIAFAGDPLASSYSFGDRHSVSLVWTGTFWQILYTS